MPEQNFIVEVESITGLKIKVTVAAGSELAAIHNVESIIDLQGCLDLSEDFDVSLPKSDIASIRIAS